MTIAEARFADALDLDARERVRTLTGQLRGEHLALGATWSRNARRVSGERTRTKSHGCDMPTDGAAWAASSTRSSTSGAIGSPVNSRRVSRRRLITS